MDKNAYQIIRLRMERTAEALRKNNMTCYCAENAEEALELVKEHIKETDKVAVGGSVTLEEIGALDYLRSGACRFVDRYESNLSREEITERFREAFFADVFLTSTNAVTENGELFNIDGNGNRVAPMIYGPDSVIVVAGCNKIVRDLTEAEMRLKTVASPANCVRLNRNTPCAKIGKCMDCHSPERICCSYVTLKQQRVPGRIKVILVGEELGY